MTRQEQLKKVANKVGIEVATSPGLYHDPRKLYIFYFNRSHVITVKGISQAQLWLNGYRKGYYRKSR